MAPPARVLDAVRRAAEAAGFSAEHSGPNTIVLRGPTRPGWCLPLAGLLMLPTLGVSLFLLRVRTTSTGKATLVDSHQGLRLKFSGYLPDYLPSVIENVLAEQWPLDSEDNYATAGTFAPSTQSVSPFPSASAAQPRSKFLDQAVAEVDGASDVNATVARPRRIDLSGAAPLLTFDNGVTATVNSFALIGRAPSAEPGDPPAQLLPITDPELSVSKTHLSAGVDALGFWVCDRHSTNGTAITDVHGIKMHCVAGKRHYVDSGSTVEVGDRSFSVVVVSSSLGRSH